MPALISEDILRLEPDGIGYQAARFQLPVAPSDANTMVFYYKAYFDEIVITSGESTESGSSYAWDVSCMFGLSFTGTISSNVGGFLGFANGNVPTSIIRYRTPAAYAPFSNNSGYSSVVPVGFGNQSAFFYGSGTNSQYNDYHAIGNSNYAAGTICPSTYPIGLEGVQKYLGIIKVSKNQNLRREIVMSYGSNWEGMPSDDYKNALNSSLTNWAFQNVSKLETVNFRPNYLDPALEHIINFPRWIVVRYPSAVTQHKFIITDIKVEYYS